MKKRFTILAVAFALLAFLAIPMGMRGQTRDTQTVSYGWETSDDAEPWTISDAIVATSGEGNTGTFAGKINTNSTTVQFNEKVYVTSFSYAFKRTSNNNNYSVYIETSTDGSNWSIKDTQAMNTFTNGSYRTVTKEFDGTQELYVRFRCNNTTAIRYVDDVTITYATSAVQLDPCDLMLTNASTSIVFDLYNNSDAYVINYTTSSTGEVTVADSDYIATVVDQTNKTITVTPVAVTNGAKVVTVNQAADDNYAAGSKTFTINITDSTPFAGGDVTFDATVDKDLGNVEAGEGSITKLGVTFACSNGILGNGSEYRMYKNSETTFFVSEGTITQIAFTGTSNNPASGFATQAGWTTDGNNGTWTGSAQEVSFTASGAQVRATLIVVTVDLGGTPAPSIIADDVNITYNATSGNIAYTIDNAVTDGTMSVATESDWLTLGQGTTSPISFTCSANSAGTDRTATVTLTYTYNRATVTANVIVTQAGNPDATMTIAEVRAQGTGNVATLGTVTSITGTSNKTAYIQDATAAIVVYGNFTAALGDEIRVSGTLSDFNGLLEITNPVVTVVSTGNTINPELMTIAEINVSANQGWYIRVENATVTAISGQNTTIAQGDNTIVVRGISGVDYAVNDILSLNGNIGYYNGNQIANPQNIEVQHNIEPSINISNATVNVPAQGAEGTITVVYENIEEMVANVYFCDAEGDAASYDWIYAEVDDDNNLYYSINPNDGEARTAYLKVYEGNTNTYSNLVTINQAAYVAPTYAELPFEFNEGRAAIEETDGLYQEGLGTDYSATNAPNTKLKFDGTGDWLLLQFNERPGTLTFNIRNNSFSGGTFKVQTSEDGVTYTDLFTYTEITETQDEEFSDLGENVRYIKWIYTEKVSGNVGLGNIVLNEYTEPESSITLDTYNIEVAAEGGEGSVNVTYQNFSGSYCDVYFYAADGVTNASYDWITAELDSDYNVHYVVQANTGEARIAYFKVGDGAVLDDVDLKSRDGVLVPPAVYVYSDLVTVTQAAYVPPFEPATYTLATTIESGKTYIIVGQGDGNYYAMGQQNNNNRAAVGIAVNGTTATVSSEEVYEFTISSLAADGFYSIYDARTPGYLYAAASGSNHLKTESELDSDHNGEWEITFDTDNIASIVASQSSNRNVMQYNSSANLFSCYSSASQHPVYLYVKEETSQTVTQTIELAAGTNWVSTYVEITKEDLQNALVAALSDPAGTVIKSQNGNSTYRGGRWRDQSFTWDVAKMYKIVVPEDCEITLTGMPINPAEHPITIAPNAPTWIGFPFAESMTPAQAIPAGFAVNADIIKGKDGNARYGNGNWRAQGLNSLEPGKGYMYVSGASATEERTLVYPSAK